MCFCKIQANNMLKCPPCIIFYFALYVCFILHKKFIQERTFLNLLSSNFKDGYISNHRNKSQAGNLQSCKELKIISRKHSWTRNKHLILLSQITEQGVQSVYLLLFKISAGLNVLLLVPEPLWADRMNSRVLKIKDGKFVKVQKFYDGLKLCAVDSQTSKNFNSKIIQICLSGNPKTGNSIVYTDSFICALIYCMKWVIVSLIKK